MIIYRMTLIYREVILIMEIEFLAKEGEDPRRMLAEQLVKDIPLGACSQLIICHLKRVC